MPVKVKIAEPGVTYFITFTCFNWLALIQNTNSYDLVYKWFNHLKDKGHLIVGYVIMPNHIQVVIAFIRPPSQLSQSLALQSETSAGKGYLMRLGNEAVKWTVRTYPKLT